MMDGMMKLKAVFLLAKCSYLMAQQLLLLYHIISDH